MIGLTKLNPDIPEELRGTYAGLAHPSTIAYLKNLGVTTVELLPVHQHVDEQRLQQMGLVNYWGYNTLNFFTPHGGLREPRRTARRYGRGAPRVQGDGAAAARGRHRGRARRRLQPHLGGGARRADQQLPRARRRELLPSRRDRRLHRRHRMRQHRRLLEGRDPAARARFAAVLGERRADRRIPVRPDRDAGPRRARRVRPAASAARGDHRRPRARGRQDDRRAVGRRRRRLAGRRVPRRLVGVERRLPRSHAQLLAARHRPGACRRHPERGHRIARPPPRRLEPRLHARARAARQRQLHHRARRLHRGRPRRRTTRSTTWETASTTTTAPTTTSRSTTATRARPRMRRCCRRGGVRSATCWARSC